MYCTNCGKYQEDSSAFCTLCGAKLVVGNQLNSNINSNKNDVDGKIEYIKSIPVTTSDLSQSYEVIGPVITNTSNKGVFSSAWTKLQKKYTVAPYSKFIVRPSKESLNTSELGMALFTIFVDGAFGFEGSVGQSNFDSAFYICIAELKLRCVEMGGNAIVGMRMDFDLDTNNYGAFYLQMYGTAVRTENYDASFALTDPNAKVALSNNELPEL